MDDQNVRCECTEPGASWWGCCGDRPRDWRRHWVNSRGEGVRGKAGQAYSQNTCCQCTEPAAGPTIEEEIRWSGRRGWQCKWGQERVGKGGGGGEPKRAYSGKRAASAWSQRWGPKSRQRCGEVKRIDWRWEWVNPGGRSAWGKAGAGGEPKCTLRACKASCRAQNGREDVMWECVGKGERVGSQNARCERAEPAAQSEIEVEMRWGWAKGMAVPMGGFRRREHTGKGGGRWGAKTRVEPAAGLKIEVDMRWGREKGLVVRLGKFQRRERAGKGGAPAAQPEIEVDMRWWRTKRMAVRMGGFRRRERAGKGGGRWGAKMRAEPAAGPKIEVNMRWRWLKGLAVRLGGFRQQERAGKAGVRRELKRAQRAPSASCTARNRGRHAVEMIKGTGGANGQIPAAGARRRRRGCAGSQIGLLFLWTDLRGVSSGFKMRRTFSTCLGNGRCPRSRGGPGRARWRKQRVMQAETNNPIRPN
ncbi:hypothetical protein B0H19DRAFT_1335373 [Mycena capillaripes]|nr:hypothetical protein B0H19DRAFT_1335373 [Mycena capillaripes]